jgi:hypothetical protein
LALELLLQPERFRDLCAQRLGYGSTVNFARRGTLWFFLFLMLLPLAILGSVLLSRAF